MQMEMWRHMFSPELSIAEKMIRPILVYAFLIIGLRLAGKRELAQLNPFDLVVLLSLSNTVQNAIIGEDNSVAGGMLGAFSLLLINYIVVRFVFGHRRLDGVLEGKPTVLVQNGEIDNKALARELITRVELDTVARRQGFDGANELETCILEPGGAFFMKRKEPTGDEKRQLDLTAKRDAIVSELATIRAKLA